MLKPIVFKAIPVLVRGNSTEGQLVLAGGELAAVIARLDSKVLDPKLAGRWHLESGFGDCAELEDRTFASLDEASAWVQARLSDTHPAEDARACVDLNEDAETDEPIRRHVRAILRQLKASRQVEGSPHGSEAWKCIRS